MGRRDKEGGQWRTEAGVGAGGGGVSGLVGRAERAAGGNPGGLPAGGVCLRAQPPLASGDAGVCAASPLGM